MNCCNCQKRIKTPKPDYSVAELVELCRPRCIECNPDEMPRGGRSHVQANDFTLSRRKIDPCDAVPVAENQADTDIVGVSPEAFDRLRKAMTALFALSPLDLLIVQHIANGGKMAKFPEVYINLMEKCKRYHGDARQMVRARKENIVSKIPQLRPMIQHMLTANGRADSRITED